MSGTPPERSIADPTGHIVAVTAFHKLKQASRSKIITPCAPRLLPCSIVDAPSHHVIYLRSFLSAPLMHIAQLLSLAGLRPWTCETCGWYSGTWASCNGVWVSLEFSAASRYHLHVATALSIQVLVSLGADSKSYELPVWTRQKGKAAGLSGWRQPLV